MQNNYGRIVVKMKVLKIEDKFKQDKQDFKILHPLDWLKTLQKVNSFLENQIQELKKDCNSAFKYQYYKRELQDDWGQWSHKTNKILRQRIQDTEKDDKKLNKQYKYVYQYWWQSNFYFEMINNFNLLKSQKIKKKEFLKSKKQLEKIIKGIKGD